MKCRELIESLLEYVEDTLEADDRRRFDDHLEECGDCLAFLSSYLETLKLSRGAVLRCEEEASSLPLPEDFVHSLLQALPEDS